LPLVVTPSTTTSWREILAVTPETVGALIFMFEVQTLFAGGLWGIDPLD
jgi:glucose-6-phosphate isomerase